MQCNFKDTFMNGYSLTEKLRKTRRWVKLTVAEQALFYELVAICNEKQWPQEFQCSNTQLCTALNLSQGALRKSREALIVAKLIHFQSGKGAWKPCCYSFVKGESGHPLNTSPTDTLNMSPHDTLNMSPHDILNMSPRDNLSINKYNIKTPSIPQTKASVREELLSDESWREQVAMQSGLSIRFLQIFPAQVDLFLQYIAAIGEEHTIKTLSDAKRRFFFWWKTYGKKTYDEEQTNQPEVW